MVIPTKAIDTELLTKAGFTKDLISGETVLPSPVFRPVSSYNALGKIKVRKDLPMETAYRQQEWRWKQWKRRYDYEDCSKIVDVPYKRYPREEIPPPSIELQLSTTEDGETCFQSPVIPYTLEHEKLLLHAINIFFEIFGECSIVSHDLKVLPLAKVKRLNWKVLPPGKYPWEKLHREVKGAIQSAPKGNWVVIEHRLKTINGKGPEFVAMGQAGFRGYIVFGFPERNLYILEGTSYGNARYVFREDWERLSQMTKAEILADDLQAYRIVHRDTWNRHLSSVFTKNPKVVGEE